LVTDAFGGYGGIAKFNRDFITALAAMPECAEVIAVPRLVPAPIEPVPRRVKFLATAAGGKLRYAFTVIKVALSGPFNLVVTGHINLTAFGALLACLKNARSALIIHGIDAWTPHHSWFVRASLPRMDYVIGVSNVTLERFGKWTHVDQARFRLLPNCVDMKRFTPGPKPADLARQLGLIGRTVIMTLGRLASEERYKGFDEVIEALPELARKIPNVSYLICGDGPDRARLEDKARSLGVHDRVVFAGFISETRKVDYYRLADAYVMPSRGEGFGIVFLEALACGLPVMGSTVDGTREALLDGALGELVDPANAWQIVVGIMNTLARHKGVPDRLQEYSTSAFHKRASEIANEILTCR
jgi:glycosyltransferase involved in cell wall biosynthesis